jgi:cytochrome c-type biogenesis protein CcmH/NrfG
MTARCLILAFLLLPAAARPEQAAAPPVDKAAAAALKRDSARCRAHADIDACYDAIRWNPGDPSLLVSLGDALLVANRPADALRNYRRAAALSPGMRGLAAKISATEPKVPRRFGGTSAADRTAETASVKHYSNAAPPAQSH